jgi:hypothetical protein
MFLSWFENFRKAMASSLDYVPEILRFLGFSNFKERN